MEEALESILGLLASERRKYGAALDMTLRFGMTVGSKKHFTRTLSLSPALLAKLVALGIKVEISAYPCGED